MQSTIRKILPIFFIIALMAVVSAYSWSYSSPRDIFQNEWIMFGAILIAAFAITFIATSKSFPDNKGAAIALSLVVGVIVAVAFAQKGLLYSYAGEGLSSWIILAAGLIFLGVAIKAIHAFFGRIGAIIALVAIWIIFLFADLYRVLPYSNVGEFILRIQDFANDPWGIVVGIIIIGTIIGLIWKHGDTGRGFHFKF